MSYPAIKQWIYLGKVKAVKTPGGHYRIPESQLDRYLRRSLKGPKLGASTCSALSSRNQLVGRVVQIEMDGLLAKVVLSIGTQRVTSIITSDAVRELRLKVGDTAVALMKSTEVMIGLP